MYFFPLGESAPGSRSLLPNPSPAILFASASQPNRRRRRLPPAGRVRPGGLLPGPVLPQDLQLRLHEEEEEPLGRRGVQDGAGRQAESRPGQRLRQAVAAAGAAHAAAATASAAPAAAPSALLRVKF